jgi:hypothetical protein
MVLDSRCSNNGNDGSSRNSNNNNGVPPSSLFNELRVPEVMPSAAGSQIPPSIQAILQQQVRALSGSGSSTPSLLDILDQAIELIEAYNRSTARRNAAADTNNEVDKDRDKQ